MPEDLYEEVIEVDERVVIQRSDCQMTSSRNWRTEKTSTDENVLISRELDIQRTKMDLISLKEKGIQSLAVILLHSYK